MIDFSKLWDQKLTRCPYALLICQYSMPNSLYTKNQCALRLSFQTCERIQEEVVGKRPQDVRNAHDMATRK